MSDPQPDKLKKSPPRAEPLQPDRPGRGDATDPASGNGADEAAAEKQREQPGLLAGEFDRLEVVNRCRSGARVGDTLEQARPFIDEAARFDLVLVVAGGNDVLQMTPSRELEDASVTLLQRLGSMADRVVWMGCADVGSAPALLPPMSWWFTSQTRRVSRVIARTIDRGGADGSLAHRIVGRLIPEVIKRSCRAATRASQVSRGAHAGGPPERFSDSAGTS